MSLSTAQKKQFKKIAHHLKPVILLGENGVTEGVLAELERALEDHELIKIKIAGVEREYKQELVDSLCETSRAELVTMIGHTAVLFRPARKPNPKLSNLLRYSLD